MAKPKWSRTLASIKSLLSSLTCPMCTAIMKKPASGGICSHVYCHDCIMRHCKALGEFRCPECRQPFWKKDLHVHHEMEQIIILCQKMQVKLEAAPEIVKPVEQTDDKMDTDKQKDVIRHSAGTNSSPTIGVCSKGVSKTDSCNSEKTDNQDEEPLVEDEVAALFHTPPTPEKNDVDDDPDSFVTASSESPKQNDKEEPATSLKHSGVASSSCQTLNLEAPPESHSNINSIFDESDDGDLPAFDLETENDNSNNGQTVTDVAMAHDVTKVSLPTTPSENISQKSCHIKPVSRTYSRRNRHSHCPKANIPKIVDEDNPVTSWLENSALHDGEMALEKKEHSLENKSFEKLDKRTTRNSSSSSVKCLDGVLKVVEQNDQKSRIFSKTLSKKSSESISGTRLTRSRVSSSSSVKSVEILKTPVTKRKSSENDGQSKRIKTSSPATTPELKTPVFVRKTPRCAKTPGRTPKTPSSTPRSKRNQKGETLLHRAAITGDIDKLQFLLEENEIDVNSKDNAGWTPLHEACIKKHVECARLLLEYGAEVNAKAENHDTPLHDACSKDALAIIRLLLDHGACKVLKNMDGFTPVHFARSDKAIQLLDEATDSRHLSVYEKDSSLVDIAADVLIAFSGVSNAQFGKYQKMKGLSFKLADEVSSKVTFLVCALDENKCCKRTIKFLNAMALGVLIVSLDWLEESYKTSTWLNAMEFMVRGAVNSEQFAPCRSFTDQKKGFPRLFTGLTFFVDKQINSKLSKDTICGLIQAANGKLVGRAPKDPVNLKTKVYHATEDSILHTHSTIMISDSHISTELLVRPTSWVLDCISSYKLIE
ncbi:hypothetical protein ACHWQZ_G005979 [Mnemiopsis leidyi]